MAKRQSRENFQQTSGQTSTKNPGENILEITVYAYGTKIEALTIAEKYWKEFRQTVINNFYNTNHPETHTNNFHGQIQIIIKDIDNHNKRKIEIINCNILEYINKNLKSYSLEYLADIFMKTNKLEWHHSYEFFGHDSTKYFYPWIFKHHCETMNKMVSKQEETSRVETCAKFSIEMKRYNKEIQDRIRARNMFCTKINQISEDLMIVLKEWLGAI
jgi:hypothetical protein